MKIFFFAVLITISTALFAQIERPEWELGGGIRFNYTGLGGGMSGRRKSDGYTFDIKYKEIGMDNYAPSFAIAFGGRYKKWNIEFAGSRGSYKGEFTVPTNVVRDDVQIDSGSTVKGKINLTMLGLTTSFGIIQRKHDLGIGIGVLMLNMGSNYTTPDANGNEINLGSSEWFPMPFLAIGGKLKFGDFKISSTGGGAYFDGKMSSYDYNVIYATLDVNAAYEFYNNNRIALLADLGYRLLYMDLEMENDLGVYNELDFYQGPYVTIRIKLFSKKMWTYVKRKDRKKKLTL